MPFRAGRHLSDDELMRAIDQELPGRLAVPLSRHLEGCGGCRGRLHQLQGAATAFADAYRVHTPAESRRPLFSRTRLVARLAEEARSEPKQRRPFRALLVAGAAAVIVAAAVWRNGIGSDALGAGYIAREAGALPVAALTPGAIVTDRADEVCRGTTNAVVIPAAVRTSVVEAYGMSDVPPHEYELDFLITPALGGSADPRNLWPERYGSRIWNAHVKDQLEDRLRELVCEGRLDLATAQRAIATDWIAAYRKYLQRSSPPGAS